VSRRGRAVTGLTFMAFAHAAPAAAAAALFAAFGPEAVKFFALQAIVAVLVSVLVDYIEHYGLMRAIKTSAAMSKQSGGGRTPGRSDSKDSTAVDSDEEGDGEDEGDYVDTSSASAATTSQVGRCRFIQVKTRVESASFRCLKVKYDKLLSRFAFNFNLRPFTQYEKVNHSHSWTAPHRAGGSSKASSRPMFNRRAASARL